MRLGMSFPRMGFFVPLMQMQRLNYIFNQAYIAIFWSIRQEPTRKFGWVLGGKDTGDTYVLFFYVEPYGRIDGTSG